MIGKGACWTGFWVGSAISAFTLLAAMFGPHGLSLSGLERGLGARVEQALAAGGFRDVTVTMDGQTAVLSGAVPSAAQKAEAAAAALTAAGPGGPYLGGVTAVRDETVVGARVSPFSWNAELSGDTLTLAGHVPSETAKAALLDVARARFGGMTVVDRMTLAFGAPAGDWSGVAADALAQLGKLKRGKVRLVDDRLTLIGEGEQAAVADVRARYADPLAAPYTLAVADLTVEGQGLGIREIEGLNLSEASAETCQRAFTQLMRANYIEFDTGSAAIAPISRQLLDNLAAVARRCDSYAIAVAGYTDNTGDPAANVALSRARANAVRDYLVGRGVALERLTAEGFGEANPRAPNTNAANRARNRRIEFNVK
ncbi:MAG: OmpA family protein [Hyphomonadaceae bacterium]|nr:OmpA family protein [Hyphomonadaceae bacterium]